MPAKASTVASNALIHHSALHTPYGIANARSPLSMELVPIFSEAFQSETASTLTGHWLLVLQLAPL